ncbi:hypothetical protein SUGI_0668820 [Cryptomeria japonica]|nr:hypothetical protein SUGI_0668820 [Cryptomeria japonica]
MTTSQEMMQQRHVQLLLKNEDFKFSSSNIGARGAKVLVGALREGNSLKDAAPSLRLVIIGENNITPIAAPSLATCLAIKDLLTNFYAGDNKLKDYGSIIICKAISTGHEQLKVLDLRENDMTVIGAEAVVGANKPNA